MLKICKAYGQLRLFQFQSVGENGVQRAHNTVHVIKGLNSYEFVSSNHVSFNQNCASLLTRSLSTKPRPQNEKSEKKTKVSYDPPSPYRVPGPRRYGYETKYFTGGLLPRGEHLQPISALPKYKVSDPWTKKKALFGQNDYIDILGDGSVKPSDLITGPSWLIGFKGNEMQRLTRQMAFQGKELAYLYPTRFHQMKKRVKFLYKRYNQRRSKSY